MENQSVQDAVVRALRSLGCDAGEILPIHDLQSDLGVDSTELVELSALIKTEYGMLERRVNLMGVATVGDVIERVKSQAVGMEGGHV